jgi:hypothetical protein
MRSRSQPWRDSRGACAPSGPSGPGPRSCRGCPHHFITIQPPAVEVGRHGTVMNVSVGTGNLLRDPPAQPHGGVQLALAIGQTPAPTATRPASSTSPAKAPPATRPLASRASSSTDACVSATGRTPTPTPHAARSASWDTTSSFDPPPPAPQFTPDNAQPSRPDDAASPF